MNNTGPDTTFFKIKRISDGLYSTGGETPSFTESGKLFNKRNHVTSHLNAVRKKEIVYKGCEVVQCQLFEIGETIHALDWKPTDKTLSKKHRDELRSLEQKKKSNQKRVEQLEAEIEKLKRNI
jgi:predicted ribosome quality control (RQC) complex YloA/Tae2 family protein